MGGSFFAEEAGDGMMRGSITLNVILLTSGVWLLLLAPMPRVARSSIGSGRGPLKAERWVRFPYALP